MAACKDTRYVLDKLAWMRKKGIWPNGQRYLWTDAFGVGLLVAIHAESGDRQYLDQAEWVVAEIDRVLGRPRGIRIREAPERDGQTSTIGKPLPMSWPAVRISRANSSEASCNREVYTVPARVRGGIFRLR